MTYICLGPSVIVFTWKNKFNGHTELEYQHFISRQTQTNDITLTIKSIKIQMVTSYWMYVTEKNLAVRRQWRSLIPYPRQIQYPCK